MFAALTHSLLALVVPACTRSPRPPITAEGLELNDGQKLKQVRALVFRDVELDDESVAARLRRCGIRVDGETLALVYHYNPDLRDVESPMSASVYLPDACKSRQVPLSIRADAATKDQLFQSALALTELLPRLEAEQPGLASRVKAADAVREIVRMASAIRARTHAIPSGAVRDVASEAKLLRETYLELLDTQSGDTEDKVALAASIRDDLLARSTGLSQSMAPGVPATRWPLVKVRVRTVALGTSEERPAMRVYWVAVALLGRVEPTSFDRLSSPSETFLPPANYLMWAVPAGAEGPIIERKTVLVRRQASGVQDVDLVVSPEGTPDHALVD